MKKDASGHLHGADGKFTSEGKGDGAPKAKEEKKTPDAPKQTKEEKLEAAKRVYEPNTATQGEKPSAPSRKYYRKDARGNWKQIFPENGDPVEELYRMYKKFGKSDEEARKMAESAIRVDEKGTFRSADRNLAAEGLRNASKASNLDTAELIEYYLAFDRALDYTGDYDAEDEQSYREARDGYASEIKKRHPQEFERFLKGKKDGMESYDVESLMDDVFDEITSAESKKW